MSSIPQEEVTSAGSSTAQQQEAYLKQVQAAELLRARRRQQQLLQQHLASVYKDAVAQDQARADGITAEHESRRQQLLCQQQQLQKQWQLLEQRLQQQQEQQQKDLQKQQPDVQMYARQIYQDQARRLGLQNQRRILRSHAAQNPLPPPVSVPNPTPNFTYNHPSLTPTKHPNVGLDDERSGTMEESAKKVEETSKEARLRETELKKEKDREESQRAAAVPLNQAIVAGKPTVMLPSSVMSKKEREEHKENRDKEVDGEGWEFVDVDPCEFDH